MYIESSNIIEITNYKNFSINKETKVLNNNVLIEKICAAGRFYIIFILIDRLNSIIVEASSFSFNHPMGHTLHFHTLFNDTLSWIVCLNYILVAHNIQDELSVFCIILKLFWIALKISK